MLYIIFAQVIVVYIVHVEFLLIILETKIKITYKNIFES